MKKTEEIIKKLYGSYKEFCDYHLNKIETTPEGLKDVDDKENITMPFKIDFGTRIDKPQESAMKRVEESSLNNIIKLYESYKELCNHHCNEINTIIKELKYVDIDSLVIPDLYENTHFPIDKVDGLSDTIMLFYQPYEPMTTQYSVLSAILTEIKKFSKTKSIMVNPKLVYTVVYQMKSFVFKLQYNQSRKFVKEYPDKDNEILNIKIMYFGTSFKFDFKQDDKTGECHGLTVYVDLESEVVLDSSNNKFAKKTGQLSIDVKLENNRVYIDYEKLQYDLINALHTMFSTELDGGII